MSGKNPQKRPPKNPPKTPQKRKADDAGLLSEEQLQQLQQIEDGRVWLGLKVDAQFDSNYILKVFELSERYGFDPKTLFGAIKKIQDQQEIWCKYIIDYIDDYQNVGKEETIFLFQAVQAHHIIDLFTEDDELNRKFTECMKYLQDNLHSSFEPNQPNVQTVFKQPDVFKTWFQQIFELCTGQQCSQKAPAQHTEPDDTEPDDTEPDKPLSSLSRQLSNPEYNQEKTTICSIMVLTRNIKKIIDLLFYTNTGGKYLGNHRFCDNLCFKDIYKISNVFIMQYLYSTPKDSGGYERQCKFLFYLAKECLKKFKSIPLCELFMYIYIHFYLFMFIISLLDSYLRYIPCSRIGCRLTFMSILHDEKDITTEGGLCDGTLFQLCNKVATNFFTLQPSKIIEDENSEQAKTECREKYNEQPEDTLQKICDETPLSYFPLPVISMLGKLSSVLNLSGTPTISTEYFERGNSGIWKKLNNGGYTGSLGDSIPLVYRNSQGELKLNVELISKNPKDLELGDFNYGLLICNEIKLIASRSSSNVVYASIGCDTNKIPQFKKEKTKRRFGLEQQSGSDTHASHELLLIIIYNSINNTHSFQIQNSWGKVLCSIPIPEFQLIDYMNNGTITSIYYLRVTINDRLITGGIRKKTKKNKKIKKKLRSKKRRMRF